MAEYIMTIELPPDESDSKVVSGSNANERPTRTDAEKKAAGAESALKSMVSFAAVRTFADRLISYEISQVSLRTGAREYEQKLQFGYDLLNKGLNVGMATAAGVAAGGVVGAGVALIGSTIYSLIGYAQNANTIATNKSLEDISIGMASERAGVSGRRGATQ